MWPVHRPSIFSRGFIDRSRADVFEKNEKKNNTTSVFRLENMRRNSHRKIHLFSRKFKTHSYISLKTITAYI